jgi:hypothetical protein
MAKAVRTGMEKGLRQFITQWINKIIAQDTGNLRGDITDAIRSILRPAIRSIIAGTGLNINVTIPMPAVTDPETGREYGFYHWDGTFGTSYKEPSTPGTRPFTLKELSNELQTILIDNVTRELSRKGFQYTFNITVGAI